MNEHDDMSEHWEARINALLDGELDQKEVAALKREAERDARLAQAIIDAHALQARFDELEIERAPASLRAQLAKIPRAEKQQSPRWFGFPRWAPVGALAAIPLLVVAMVMMQSPPEQSDQLDQPEYTEAEILKARQDVITAFAYLDRIGARTGQHIESELAEELSRGVNRNVSRYMPYTQQSEQEESS
jgi:anti-sigma factor RsiW